MIGRVIETEYGGDSLTIAIQDGAAAGQTVPHVHVHLIPRKFGDWANNDDIYKEIHRKEQDLDSDLKAMSSPSPSESSSSSSAAATADGSEATAASGGVDNEERPARSKEEMAKEAKNLRVFFEHFEDIWT
ncbi:hypothetical protein HK102_003663 [Quaeritorhiza haematococci]|nr:hypothetical protein HK102_003663 [Quaeritorhiza haematococci]